MSIAMPHQDLIRVLDSIAQGCVLGDCASGGQVLYINPALQQILQAERHPEKIHHQVEGMLSDLAEAAPDEEFERDTPGLAPVREVRSVGGMYRLRGSYLKEGVSDSGAVVLITVEQVAANPLSDEVLRERFRLTGRECELVRLLVEGRTNGSIAEAMRISPHTAHHYTERILLKIGVRSRAEVPSRILRG